MYPIFLLPADLDGTLRRRAGVTAAVAEDAGAEGHQITAPAGSPLEQVLSLVLLGDLVSLYFAVLQGVDPTPVVAIDRLKRALE